MRASDLSLQDDKSEDEKPSTTGGPDNRKASLGELAFVFLKLGTIAFGGPAAHIAMMEDEVVRRRRWLSRESFLDLLGATNLIPGPNSTEMAIHIGHTQAGWPGLLVAGAAFIVPAVIIVAIIAWAYVRYGALPQASAILYGIKPVIIAVVLQAIWSLGRAALKTRMLALFAAGALILSLLAINELAVLVFTGLAYCLVTTLKGTGWKRPFSGFYPQAALLQMAGTTAAGFGLLPLFLFFFKVGAVLFGGGYVLLAFLRGDLVERWHWLSDKQLLDAIAVGQVTPGPLFTTATFIGYVLAGPRGAAVATLGIFLPAFVFVALSGPLVPRIRKSATTGAFLDGVNAAAIALMAVVTFELGRSALVDIFTLLLFVLSSLLLIRYRFNSVWLIAAGALAGLAFHYL
jgi:chromate transporter